MVGWRIPGHFWLYVAAATPLLAMPVAAFGQPAISTDSSVFVERRVADAGRQLEPAAVLEPGDRVVTIVRWRRHRGSGGFVITNPLPPRVYYEQSSLSNEVVSVDGGRTWGRLDTLTVGSRRATPEDVTHVRWRITDRMAVRGSGQIAYSGIVR